MMDITDNNHSRELDRAAKFREIVDRIARLGAISEEQTRLSNDATLEWQALSRNFHELEYLGG